MLQLERLMLPKEGEYVFGKKYLLVDEEGRRGTNSSGLKNCRKEGEYVVGKRDQSTSEERERERHSSSSSSVSDCNVATTETLQQVKRGSLSVSLSVYEKIKQDMIRALEANDLASVKRLQKYLQ